MLNNSEDNSTSSVSATSGFLLLTPSACSTKSDPTLSKICLKCSDKDQIYTEKIICLCSLQYQYTIGGSIPPVLPSTPMFFENPGQLYNYINRCRKWVKVWNPENVSPNSQFSLTTYNILAQNLLLNHLYLYQNNCHSDLAWSERGERLKRELIDLNSDIFCLQEVHMAHFQSTILPALIDRGYEAVFKKKTGVNMDGCSILFKKNKFQLQDCLEVEYNRSDISHLLDRDQVGLIVKLRPIGLESSTNPNLIVANTHLLFNPKRGDIKLAQLRLLLAELQRFALRETKPNSGGNPYQMSYNPIILCGDMNSEPHSPLIKFIERGKLNLSNLKSGDISGQKEGIDRGRNFLQNDLVMRKINSDSCFNVDDNSGNDLTVRHVFDFKSAYPTMDEYDKRFVSISTTTDCGLVDHIFYSYRHKNLRLYAFKQLMNKRNLNAIGNIPNSILGSDHISLSAEFFLL